MENIYEFEGFRPIIDESAFVHPMATVIGNVTIGRDVYIAPGAVIRGDWGEIIIEDGSNFQENCIMHTYPGGIVHLREGSHIGHGAIIHGASMGRNCLVGMNAVLMDDVFLGDECIVGALCFVPAGMKIPPRKILIGNPAKIAKDITDEKISMKTKGTKIYQGLPARLHKSLKHCEPLREIPEDRPKQK
ncbi:gamma carbonic anhydrase family protein [Thermodesulfobacteriota bacterium]